MIFLKIPSVPVTEFDFSDFVNIASVAYTSITVAMGTVIVWIWNKWTTEKGITAKLTEEVLEGQISKHLDNVANTVKAVSDSQSLLYERLSSHDKRLGVLEKFKSHIEVLHPLNHPEQACVLRNKE